MHNSNSASWPLSQPRQPRRPQAKPDLFVTLKKGNWSHFKYSLQQDPTLIEQRDEAGNTLAHYAVMLMDERALKKIIKFCVAHEKMHVLQATNCYGETILHLAAKQNAVRILQELLGLSQHARYKNFAGLHELKNTPTSKAQTPLDLIHAHWDDARSTLLAEPLFFSPQDGVLFPEELATVPFANASQFVTNCRENFRRARRRVLLGAVIASFCPGATLFTGELGGMDYFLRKIDAHWVLFEVGDLRFGLVDLISWMMGVSFFVSWIWSEYRLSAAAFGGEAEQNLQLQGLYVQYAYRRRACCVAVAGHEAETNWQHLRKIAFTSLDLEANNATPMSSFQKPRPLRPLLYDRRDHVTHKARLTLHFNLLGFFICAAGGLGSLSQYLAMQALSASRYDYAENRSQWAGFAATMACLVLVLLHYPQQYRSQCQRLGDIAARRHELQEKLYYQYRHDFKDNTYFSSEHASKPK